MLIKHSILLLVFITLVGVFTSKAVFNITTTLLLLLSFYKGVKYRKIILEKIFWLYFFSIFLGIISNFITGRVEGIGNFLGNERSMFYFLIFLLLNLSSEDFKKINLGAILGGGLALINSTISYFAPTFFGIETNYYNYHFGGRMRSFHGTIRWGALLQMYAFIISIWLKKYKNYILITLIYIVIFWNILLSGTRSSLLAFTLASTFFLINYIFVIEKGISKKIVIIFFIIFGSSLFIVSKNESFENRIKTIVDIENTSNSTRIGFWKIGVDMIIQNPWIGIGSDNLDKEFLKFIELKGKDYEFKYYPIKNGVPFENAYLNLIVENGLFYTLPHYFFFFLILIKLYKKMLKNPSKNKKVFGLLLLSLVIGNRIFIFFFPGTDSYQEFLVIYSIFYMYSILKEESVEIQNVGDVK